MSEIESSFVKRGLWVDLEKSATMGSTITTDIRTGTLIAALLAVLCSLATNHLWHLITFLIHQYRADGKPSDAFSRQQQVILRTLPTPSAVVSDYIKLYFSWRGNSTRRGKFRSIVIPILAAIVTIATVLSGVFSSYVVDTTALQVLAKSSFCGPINISDESHNSVSKNYTPAVRTLAEPLAQDCYQSNSTNFARCNIYTKPRIPFHVQRTECPWPSSMCIGRDKPSVSMDSGLLDVNDAFGLNLPSNGKVQFRKKTTCAVLPLENRTTVIPATAYKGYSRPPLPEEQFLIFHFGELGGNDTWRNATFVGSLAKTNVTDGFTTRYVIGK